MIYRNESLISIVIPVYNVESYLPRCIDSILNQSYKKFEAIFINDGSKDDSLSVLKKYALKDSRIICIDKVNEGSGEARNVGLQNCNGEYVAFIDSDDWVHEDYLKLMYEEIKKNKSDVVMCNPIIAYDDESKNKKIRTGKFDKIDLKKNPEKIVDILGMPVLWNKLYRKDVIINNSIKFPKYLYHQDVEFLYKLFLNIMSISKIEVELYYYYQRSNSVTGNLNKKNIYDTYKVLDNIEKYVTEKSENKSNFYKFKIDHIYGTKVETNKKVDKKLKEELSTLAKNSLKNIELKNIVSSKRTTLFYIALKLNQEDCLNKAIKLIKTVI